MSDLTEVLEKEATKRTNRSEKQAQYYNTKPCEHCGNKDFIQLFRNVTGKVEGAFHGYYSLFGGSISGYISGSTSTLPVLSCTKCHNERKVATWNYSYAQDIFWQSMFYFYYGIENGGYTHKRSDDYLNRLKGTIFLERPLETYAYAKAHYTSDSEKEIIDWLPKKWAEAGFDLEPKTTHRKFLYWEWDEKKWPTWIELFNEEHA